MRARRPALWSLLDRTQTTALPRSALGARGPLLGRLPAPCAPPPLGATEITTPRPLQTDIFRTWARALQPRLSGCPMACRLTGHLTTLTLPPRATGVLLASHTRLSPGKPLASVLPRVRPLLPRAAASLCTWRTEMKTPSTTTATSTIRAPLIAFTARILTLLSTSRARARLARSALHPRSNVRHTTAPQAPPSLPSARPRPFAPRVFPGRSQSSPTSPAAQRASRGALALT